MTTLIIDVFYHLWLIEVILSHKCSIFENLYGKKKLTAKKVKTLQKNRNPVKLLSRVRLFATPWTIAYQAPPFMQFPRQEYWSGLPFPSPGDLPNTGIKPRSPTLQADTLPSEPPGKPRKTVKGIRNIFRFININN